MFLQWHTKYDIHEKPTCHILEDLKGTEHGEAYANWGIFRLEVSPADPKYGPFFRKKCAETIAYHISLYAQFPAPGTPGTFYGIPLLKTTGFLTDAIEAAEALLFSKTYTIPSSPIKK